MSDQKYPEKEAHQPELPGGTDIEKAYVKLKQDFADLENIERLLRKSKAWFRAIFESSSVGIAILNMNGIIIEINQAMEGILGYNSNELRDLGIENLALSENDTNSFEQLLQGDIEHFEVERPYARKDGEGVWINLKVSHVQNTGEDFQFILVMVEDITVRMQAAHKQAQLLEALKNINQELDNFAYIVSHDLKAPLRGIGSLAAWLAADYQDKLDDEGKEMIQLLSSRAERMKNFIDGILDYSRASRKKENKSEVNLNKLLADIIDSIAAPAHISITAVRPLPTILCERLRMEQVLQNLIGNAVKYNDKAAGLIRVDCTDEGSFYKISISDNGPGIEEKYFEKIFQIFQTLTPRDKFESTGIGLSIVKKIIETWKGKIWVEAEIGKGSTFYFTLPK